MWGTVVYVVEGVGPPSSAAQSPPAPQFTAPPRSFVSIKTPLPLHTAFGFPKAETTNLARQSISEERAHARKRLMGSDGVLVTRNKCKVAGLSFLVAMAAMGPVCVAATQFKVGGSSGWDLNGPNYQIWADASTYHIGDILVFTYSGMHSVVETDSAGFQGCSSSNAILQDSSGNSAIPLQSAGNHYFICGTPGHCPAGMKFSVTVLPSNSSGASNATPSPPAAAAATTTTTIPPIITIDSATALQFHHTHIMIMIAVASILLLP